MSYRVSTEVGGLEFSIEMGKVAKQADGAAYVSYGDTVILAPACAHCGTRIVGHGLEKGSRMFCCDHCAEESGVKELRDRA